MYETISAGILLVKHWQKMFLLFQENGENCHLNFHWNEELQLQLQLQLQNTSESNDKKSWRLHRCIKTANVQFKFSL